MITGSRGWTADLAYTVGLIAADGNLSRKPGRVSIMSNDIDLLELVRERLGVTRPITPHTGGYGRRCHRIVWSDRPFYEWLVSLGLTPAKSLTLGPLAVPDEYFVDFFRGCIDGDGSIVTYVDRYNAFKNCRYVYTRVYLSLVSASPRFIEWVRASLHRICGVEGSVGIRRCEGRNDIGRLRYAKREALLLLRWMYYASDVASLRRKRQKAEPFLIRRPCLEVRRPGRPVIL